ncbi:MAG: hypothetical protein V2J25_00420 [Desulfatiglans sp.]|jgi:hypothetical protein|nr:hypothetical protein [Thermodesulfobacteriota bacterium]MEE4351308.1 hypothetical protein [Desulfatiglans sp.]
MCCYGKDLNGLVKVFPSLDLSTIPISDEPEFLAQPTPFVKATGRERIAKKGV